MRSIYPEIQALGADVLVVSFSPPDKAAAFLAKYPQPFPVAVDPERRAYQRFELGRTSAAGILKPSVLGKYLRLIFKGWFPPLPEKNTDVMQLGGDFILDAAWQVRYAYPSKDPTDRPLPGVLLEEVRKATL